MQGLNKLARLGSRHFVRAVVAQAQEAKVPNLLASALAIGSDVRKGHVHAETFDKPKKLPGTGSQIKPIAHCMKRARSICIFDVANLIVINEIEFMVENRHRAKCARTMLQHGFHKGKIAVHDFFAMQRVKLLKAREESGHFLLLLFGHVFVPEVRGKEIGREYGGG